MKFRPIILATCAAISIAISVDIEAMPPAQAWEIGPNIRGRNYSVGMPSQPSSASNGSVSFEFPQNGGEVDAMTTAVRPFSGARALTMRYRVDAPRTTRFVSSETPDQTATVSLYFQQVGDNWTARGRFASYRWYVPARAVIPLTPGEHTVTVRFDEVWTNVYGRPNTQDPEGFANALNNTGRLGVAFGTLSARSHGVYATGPARFTLLALDIR